jgi:hypothetical protein
MVTFTTGGITFRADASSVPLAERESIDQLLAREPAITGDAPIRSLQLAPDVRSAALFRTAPSHTFDSVPIQLFGGGVVGGRLVVYANRPTNDLWLTIANRLGHPMTCFGDAERCTGPLTDLLG